MKPKIIKILIALIPSLLIANGEGMRLNERWLKKYDAKLQKYWHILAQLGRASLLLLGIFITSKNFTEFYSQIIENYAYILVVWAIYWNVYGVTIDLWLNRKIGNKSNSDDPLLFLDKWWLKLSFLILAIILYFI